MKRHLMSAVAAFTLALAAQPAAHAWQDTAGDDALRTAIAADYDAYLEALYRHFHAHPELSHQEFETAARLAAELEALGFDVTQGVGGTGIVAVMENGDGPTLMLRADMDGLPVPEQTGLSYASTDTDVDHRGVENPVMHACAHDTHMTALVGAARQLVERTDEWSGTLVLIGQPAEELGEGAVAMIEDGLFERFPLPDFNISFHTFSAIPTGTITYVPGYAMANVDSVDIYVQGRGGHGAYPHTTKDPIYLASQIVVSLQSLVSREVSPLEPAVVTVGAFNAGAKHNIISDGAHLQLTVRSYTDEVREQLLSGIQRIAANQAASYGLTPEEYPRVEIEETYTPALYNSPDLAARAVDTMRSRFGAEAVVEASPVMGGEDFSQYHRTEHNIPTFMFWVGGTTRETLADYTARGLVPPSNHSPFFAPDDPQGSITQATEAMAAVALDILAAPSGE
ncbi:peptidase M20 [Maricaulis sp. W15]|uniref:M20 metallopeptidase family protein n=1 Tax=Maricaulis sp. W15 TaxID=1772333 RepID=UPI0009489D25|nr:amidohydrolase [Maricaulis sp. W15]OLF78248.1 peptidase M20 [Maricaulis sp. W15]